MRRSWAIGLLGMVTALPALAVDKATFQCEDKSSAAVNAYGGARGKCLIKCENTKQKEIIKNGSSTLQCSNPPGVNDQKTIDCLAKADAKYAAAVPKACPSGMPACGSYAGMTAAMYAAGQIATQGSLIDSTTVPLVACDGSLIKGETKAVGILAKLSSAIGKCLGKCYARAQLKGEAINCTPDMTPWDNLETKTKDCVLKNIDKANLGIGKALPTLPACGLWPSGLPAVLDLVTGSIAGNYSMPSSNPYCAP